MSRLTKQYEDTKRYYSTHSCDEVLQKLGKLEDKEEVILPYYLNYGGYKIGNWHCRNCDGIIKNGDRYCKHCGQRLGDKDDTTGRC